MTQQISPFLEAKYGWSYGESGWNGGMDDNLLKFSFMFDRNVDDISATLPPPTNGASVYLTTDNRLYFAVGTTWYSCPAPKWGYITRKSSGELYQFDGTTLNQVDSNAVLQADLDLVQLTIASLGTAAYQNTEYFAEQSELDIVASQASNYTDDLRNDLASATGTDLVGFQRSALTAAISTAGQMLSAQPVSVWEYAGLITAKGDAADPATWDWTPAIQAALDSGASAVTVPDGEYRVDGTIIVPASVSLFNAGVLIRKAAYSANTSPVLNVQGSRAVFGGGEIATENAHPAGVVRLGHDTTAAEYTTTKWQLTDCVVRGVQAPGNIGISLVCAQSSNAGNPANYFGHVANVIVLNADVGVQCEEYANAHTFVNVLFWNCITAAFRFYGAYGNCVQGGFVHTGSVGITGVILADSRLASPMHHSDSNFVLGLGIEPAVADAFGYRIGANSQRNILQLSANVAGGNEILNSNNTVQNVFGKSFMQSGVLHSTASLELTESIQSTHHIEKFGSATGISENFATTVANITVPVRNNLVVKLDLCVSNAQLDVDLAASLTYSLRNIGGVITATQIDGGINGDGATVSWDTAANPAKLRFTTFNNGTATTFSASWRLSVQAPSALPTIA